MPDPNRQALRMLAAIVVVACVSLFAGLYVLKIWGLVEGKEVFVKTAETVAVGVAAVGLIYVLFQALRGKDGG